MFSGDSGPCPGLTRAARGTDLLVVECAAEMESTGASESVTGHLTPETAGELAAETEPGLLVLTHLQPSPLPPEQRLERLQNRDRRRYAGPLQVARDGDLYRVPASAPATEETS